MNEWSQKGIPFCFAIDFELSKIILERLETADPALISFDFNGKTNVITEHPETPIPFFDVAEISKSSYAKAFNQVIDQLNYGNSFLLNLTSKARIINQLSLKNIFDHVEAKYKIFVKDQFTCFSPECFIKTVDGHIFTYPMKGTIDANLPYAAQTLLNDAKESAEHATIVDLMRNDLSIVASKVRLNKFKYLDLIRNQKGAILQMSSEIRGQIRPEFVQNAGDLMFSLLPAGSISGAPKSKTVNIIRAVEGENRGYYTGVCGVFDGKEIDSGVMIRFVEEKNNTLYYRTGGGITFQSEMEKEYKELTDKIYVPINRNHQDLQRQGLQHQIS